MNIVRVLSIISILLLCYIGLWYEIFKITQERDTWKENYSILQETKCDNYIYYEDSTKRSMKNLTKWRG